MKQVIVSSAGATLKTHSWLAFRRIWIGASISVLGDQVTMFAVPTITILIFHSTPTQAGLISALAVLTYPAAGLFVGVVTDRVRNVPAIIAASATRVMLLGTLGAAALVHTLNLWLLGILVVASALCGVIADVGMQSLTPQIVQPEQLIAANSRLASSWAIAQMAGPGIGGLLIDALGPAAALFADSFSFIPLIGTLIRWSRDPVNKPLARHGRTWSLRSMLTDLRDGLRFMRADGVLWRLPATASVSNFGTQLFRIAFLVEAYRIFRFSAGQAGFALIFMGAGAVLGSMLTTFLISRIGGPRLMIFTIVGEAVALLPIALVPAAAALPACSCCFLVAGMIGIPWNAVSKTVRMERTPAELQGRTNGTARTLALTGSGLGILTGGILVSAATSLLGAAWGARTGALAGVVIAGMSIFLLINAPWTASGSSGDAINSPPKGRVTQMPINQQNRLER